MIDRGGWSGQGGRRQSAIDGVPTVEAEIDIHRAGEAETEQL
jgi:hypothetical protein